MAEKNGFHITKLTYHRMCGTVMQWSRSCSHLQMNWVRLLATLFSVSLYRFFFSVYSLFFNRIFPLGLFSFVLTSDPPDLALGSIYILSLSPDFYFGKGISWSWSWSFVHCLNHNSIIFKFKFKVDRLQIMVVAKKYIYVS